MTLQLQQQQQQQDQQKGDTLGMPALQATSIMMRKTLMLMKLHLQQHLQQQLQQQQ